MVLSVYQKQKSLRKREIEASLSLLWESLRFREGVGIGLFVVVREPSRSNHDREKHGKESQSQYRPEK